MKDGSRRVGGEGVLLLAGVLLVICAGCATSQPGQDTPTAPPQPNFVIILADDLGYGDLACYGSSGVSTPNIDSLARGGMRFTDFHSNGPMCSPTRAALLTGRYQQRCGIEAVLGFREEGATAVGMASEEITFAEIMRSLGYRTGVFGKWHTGHLPDFAPTLQGFDTFRGFYGGVDYHSHFNRIGQENWWRNTELIPEEGYVTELITRHTVQFIEENQDEPFCLYVPHFAVHFPWQGPDDPADFARGLDCSSPAKKYGSRLDRKAVYREMIEALDESVGQIIDTLDRLGLKERTCVFFLSDNGGHDMVASNAPLAGYKGSLLEGGHRVPAIVWWPGKIEAGSESHEIAATMDIFPTLLDLSGAEAFQELQLDGISFAPLLLRHEALPERTLFWRHREEWAARRGDWKLFSGGQQKSLYNLSDDLGESRNLVDERPVIAQQLEAAYLAWEKEVTADVTWVGR